MGYEATDELNRKVTQVRHLRALMDVLADCDGPLPFDQREIKMQLRDNDHRLILMQVMSDYRFTFGSFEPYPDSDGGRLPFYRDGDLVGCLYGYLTAFDLLAEEAPEEEAEGPLPGDGEGPVEDEWDLSYHGSRR